jgi:hypothetical protein
MMMMMMKKTSENILKKKDNIVTCRLVHAINKTGYISDDWIY